MRAMIQVPVSPQFRNKVEKKAKTDGFSSVQQLIRLVLSKYESGHLEVGFREAEPIKLSPEAKKRYKRMEEDFEKGKNIRTAHGVNELMHQLLDED